MKTKIKKWLIAGAVVSVVLFLIGFGFRDFWFIQFRIYVLGLAEARADQFGYQLPEIDEIEIMALGSVDTTAANGPDRIDHYAITGRAMIRGLLRGRAFSAMCHEPGYALRFRRGGKTLFETTVCWECQNFTIPMGPLGRFHYGFAAERQDAQDLLKVLQSLVPLASETET
jgi:hypothetical protein